MTGDLYSEREIATRLGISAHVLRDWRLRGTGPPYRDLDGEALYDLDEVVEWLDSRVNREGASRADQPTAPHDASGRP